MDNRKSIYISIPITGHDIDKVRERADVVKGWLSKRGYKVFNPLDVYLGENATYGQLMGHDITTIIDHATTIFMCKGWKESKGCRLEYAAAQIYGKEILYETVEEPEIYWR